MFREKVSLVVFLFRNDSYDSKIELVIKKVVNDLLKILVLLLKFLLNFMDFVVLFFRDYVYFIVLVLFYKVVLEFWFFERLRKF